MWMYRILQGFLRIVTSVFFRNIAIIGKENVPKSGAVIFAGNHPNSLMDPMLVIAYGGRVVHFAAKDILFKSRFLRFFLRGLGAVPIQRRKDHKGNIDNSSAFDALFQVLEEGRAMGIFPEGISHTAAQLSSLKTGAARIALQWFEQHEGQLPLYIVPVGLNYLHRQRFRSQVLIQFGEPLEVTSEWLEKYQQASKETVVELTEQLNLELRKVTVNAPDWDVLRVLHTARRLYKPSGVFLDLPVYAELTRRLAEGYMRAEDEPEIQALRQQLEEYQGRLDALGLEDHHLRSDMSAIRLVGRLLWRLVTLLFLLPLAIPGIILHAPVMMTAVVAGDYLTARKDVVATTKLISSILLVPLLYILLLLLLIQVTPWTTVITMAVLLPLSGFATVRLLERQAALYRSLRGLWRWVYLRRELSELREWRVRLSAALDQAVERFHDRSVPRLFEKGAES
ncbi:MAG: hypothetical protein EP343_22395 [Deltaproteobacteria bacterium]|nr:MAG: hypothetical protein EP343_22395 [Deltaproteobacteria bacterium]